MSKNPHLSWCHWSLVTPTFDIMAITHSNALSQATQIDNYVERAELSLHAMLRRQFELLAIAASRVTSGAQDRASAVASHAEVVVAALDLHCRGETEALWPLLVERSCDSFEWPERRMRKDHGEVGDLLDEFEAALQRWRYSATASRRDTFIEVTGRLIVALERHLHHEEQLVLPLMKQHITAGEFDAIVETQAFNFEPWLQSLLLGMLMQQGDSGVVDRASVMVAAAVRRRAALATGVGMYQPDVSFDTDRTFAATVAAVKRRAAAEYLEHCHRMA